MALAALLLVERALAKLFMAAHALLVEGVHSSGNELFSSDPVAYGTVCLQGVQLDQAGFGQHVAHGLHAVAAGAALGLVCKHVFVTGDAFGVHGIGQIGGSALFGGLAARNARRVAIGAILRFRLDVGVFVVAFPAIEAQFFIVSLVAPFLDAHFVVMAGGTCGIVVEPGHMIFAERLVEVHAMTGFTCLHLQALFRAFVVACLAWHVIGVGMVSMLKNHCAAGILQQNTFGHGFLVCRQQISQRGDSGQNARQNGNCKITFLQRSPPDMAIINNATDPGRTGSTV